MFSVTTEPRTGQLMVMAPELVHRNIAAQLQTLMTSVRNSPQSNDKGLSVASYQQQNVSSAQSQLARNGRFV